ncbi:TonB-dependent hemoglobin/transferrin/lactoferrin family receptor [Pseudomonas sp. PDNC002]|uniref:TonB-dependent hemoglobin/transferrin/lactoferrin family receptor n=1 Tax=Pseudomonas sp. PDNC002 TaxID=2811422 RepID=UPI0019639AB1|nr:TonB-dependent hemoglobin/transferrin/lactoferrin family receptor [Pseudomonas sp. PDNC002]QRY79559.1 TonB-dependent hemoglobin/transferrin/lactoferrin family receptor [Pseudomonas sp. PDNC002]
MSITPPFPRRSWLALLLLCPSLALADNMVSLGETTVTATRSEQPVDAVPSTVSVQTARDIDRNNANDIKQLVRYEPGVSVSGSGSRFGLSGFTIRGIGGNRVLTQVDGVAVPSSFAFGPFMDARRNYIDLDTAKRVEILRGPASSLYGSDALGGAVSFMTKDAADYLHDGKDTYARFKVGFDGSDRSWLKSATVAGRTGPMDGLVTISRRDGHETDTFGDNNGIGSARGEANPVDGSTDNLLAKLGWDYAEGSRLQLAYERYNDDADTRLLNEYSTTGTTRTSDATDSTDRERVSLSHRFLLDSALADQVQWQLNYQDSQIRQETYQERFSAGRLRDRSRDSKYEETLWGLNSQLDKQFALADTQHHLIYGFDLKRLESKDLRKGGEVYQSNGQPVPPAFGAETFPLSDFPDPVTREYAAFIQDSIEIGRWTLLPGLRYDYYEMKPDVSQRYLNSNPVDKDPSNFSDHALSPKFGVTYRLDDHHSVYGQYAAGFRAPEPVDIFGEFVNTAIGYQTIANTNLKPETSDSYEVGLRGKYDMGSFGVALFYNRYDDFIEQVTLPNDPTGNNRLTYQYTNLDKVTIKGAEARGDLDLNQAIGLPAGTTLRGAVSYAKGKDEETGEPINSVDPLKGVFGLGYDAPSGQFGSELTWTLVQAKHDIDEDEIPNQYKPGGYGLLDLSGWVKITDGVTLNAGLFNLTDKKYWQWGDVRGLTENSASLDRYTQPGRYAAANLIWEI